MPTPLESFLVLPDARGGVIRPVRRSDAASLLETLRAVAHDGRGVVRLPCELPQSVAEMESEIDQWTTGSRSESRGCLLVAVVDGRAVGEASIRRMARRATRHVGHVGLCVHPEYQRLGLGRALMKALLDWATLGPGAQEPDPPIARIDLFVLSDNQRAIALYHSLGFTIEGRRRRMIRRPDGASVDDLLMARLLGSL